MKGIQSNTYSVTIKRIQSNTYSETRAKRDWNIHEEDEKSTTTRRIVTSKKITSPSNKWIDATIGGKVAATICGYW